MIYINCARCELAKYDKQEKIIFYGVSSSPVFHAEKNIKIITIHLILSKIYILVNLQIYPYSKLNLPT